MFVWMAAICVLLGQTPAQGTADFMLDLAARPAPAAPANGNMPAMTIGVTPHAMPPPKLQVTLLALSQPNVAPGDMVVFDVEITNVGDKPVLLPWSEYTDFLDVDTGVDLVGTVSLVVHKPGEPAPLARVPGATLIARPASPQHRLSLAPAKRARVRAKATFAPGSKEWEALQAHAGRVEWRAVFWLSQPMLRLPSFNAVEGQVAPRPR
jgi:hypothetical protein